MRLVRGLGGRGYPEALASKDNDAAKDSQGEERVEDPWRLTATEACAAEEVLPRTATEVGVHGEASKDGQQSAYGG